MQNLPKNKCDSDTDAPVSDIQPNNIIITRSRSRAHDNLEKSEYTSFPDNYNSTPRPQKSAMSELSLETAIKLIPFFNGLNDEDVYPFLSACEFAISCVPSAIQPVLIKAIQTKLSGKAFSIIQNRTILDWPGLKSHY